MVKSITLTAAALLAFGLLAPLHADPPKPDFNDLPAYLHALNASTDPQAAAIRQEIANGPADLAKARAAAEAGGIPLTITPPNVPADQNAGPLYDQWRQDQKQGGKPGPPEYAEVLSPEYAYTPAQLARVQKFFDDNRAATTLLHQAVGKPALVFSGEEFTHFAELREAAREIVTESYLLAHAGSYTDAVADQASGFNIAKQMMTQPSLIKYLVADAMERISLGGMRNILTMAGPNAAVDAQVQQTVQQALPVLSLKPAMLGEVAVDLSEMDPLRTATPEVFASLTSQNGAQLSSHTPKTFTPEQRTFVNNLIDAVEAQYLNEMGKLIAAVGTPDQSSVFADVQGGAGAEPGSPVQSLDPIVTLSNIMENVYGQLGGMRDRGAADEQVTLAAAAILDVKAKTGAYPDALPGDFPDSFSGTALGYRREGDTGFVVYSVGPDGTFDGGKPGQYQFTPAQVFFRYPGPTPQPVPPDMLK